MGDSFDPPTGNFFLNVSGQRTWIADYSGLPIETQLFGGERFVKAWISGQFVQTNVTVQVSGVTATISVSGNPIQISGEVVRISGQTVYPVSGKGLVYGYDPSGLSWNEIYVNQSGGHSLKVDAQVSGQPVNVSGNTVIALISGQTVVASVTTDISGQTVYLASGKNDVQISGQLVAISGIVGTSVSGNVIVVPSTSISGNAVRISGETIQIAGGINVSGSPVRISGETVYPVSGKAFLYGFDQSGAIWNEIFVDTSGGHRALVAISGQTILTSVSGNQILTSVSGNNILTSISGNVVKISGETVQIAGGVSVSGNMVSISGQPVTVSGNVVRISGETVSIAGGVSVSGNAVRTSGEMTRIQAFDPSGASWLDSWTAASGSHRILVAISGETVVASVTTNISGQTVYLVSGNNAVQNSGQTVYPVSGKAFAYGFDPSGVTWNELWVNASGGHELKIAGSLSANVSGNAVRVSGETVYPVSGKSFTQIFDPSGNQWVDLWSRASGSHDLAITANVTTNISGQVVYLTSGKNDVQISGQAVIISGQTVSVSGLVATSVSGNMVSISGQPVSTSVSGNAIQISGQIFYPVSGKAFNQAFDPSGATWNDIWISQSGGHRVLVAISGETVSIAGGVSVSGNMVTISGQPVTISGNVVQISGQLVAVSGTVATSVSGNMISISGQPVSVSGNVVRISGSVLYSVSGLVFNEAFDPSGVTWNDVWVSQSGGHRVLVAISGETVLASVSGNMVTISGQVVTVSGNIVNTSGQVAIISGQPVLVSGQLVAVSGLVATSISGNMVSISGQPVTSSGDTYITKISGEVVQISGQAVRITSTNGGAMVVTLPADGGSVSSTPLAVTSYLMAFDAGTGLYARPRVTSSGQGISGIYHKLVVTFSGDSIIGSVSGNMVSVSGQVVTVSGNVVNVSGTIVHPVSGKSYMQAFDPSGVTWNDVWVDVSGGHAIKIAGSLSANVSGNAVRVSGETVYPVSGKSFGYAFDPSGSTWNELWVSQSGGHVLQVSASVNANISGQTVYLVSGNNAVQMSGETVLTSISGNVVTVSGNSVAVFSGKVQIMDTGGAIVDINTPTGDALVTSIDSLATLAVMYAYDGTTSQLKRVRVTSSGQTISGIPFKLVVTFSGDSIIGSVSGNMVSISGQPVKISGETLRNQLFDPSGAVWRDFWNSASGSNMLLVSASISGNIVNTSGQVAIISGQPVLVSGQLVSVSGLVATSVSGNMVSISGQPVNVSGDAVRISGETIKPQIPVQIRTRDTLLITGASGGIALLSGDVLRVIVRNIGVSGTVMYVGGSGDYPWVSSGQTYPAYSGRGFWLRDGDGITIHNNNMANVRVVSHTSGQYVSYIGESYP